MPTLLSIGHGFSARALTPMLLERGWRVIGTTRTEEKAARLRDEGVEAVIWPGTDLTPLITEATHILTSVAPGGDGGEGIGDPVIRAYGEALKNAAAEWVGYLSTVGVYGDRRGGWVDETSELRPSTERGKARIAAEAAWAKLGTGAHIFRLAGIYGPGRGPFEKVRRGTARRIIKEGQVFSRIHVDDIATTVLASIDKPNPGAIYNVNDDEPAPPQDVVSHAAKLLGVPLPLEIPFEEADLPPMAKSFYAESKRCSNKRIKEELGVRLAFPTYREGLADILKRESP